MKVYTRNPLHRPSHILVGCCALLLWTPQEAKTAPLSVGGTLNPAPAELDPLGGVVLEYTLGSGSVIDSETATTATLAPTSGQPGPGALVTAAVSRRANPSAAGGVCDTNLLGGLKSEPHAGGIQQLLIDFDVPPGSASGSGVTVEQATCANPVFRGYAGTAVVSSSVAGNRLTVTFAPALENGRTYRIKLDPSVTSVAGQNVIVRGLVGDVDSDGFVNATDRSVVVGAWTGGGFSCAADINNDGDPNATDRSMVVGAWTGGTNCAPQGQDTLSITLTHTGTVNGDDFVATGIGTADPGTGVILVDWTLDEPVTDYDALCGMVNLGGAGIGSAVAREIGGALSLLTLAGGNYQLTAANEELMTQMTVSTSGGAIDVYYHTVGETDCTGIQSILPNTHNWVPGPPGSNEFTERMLAVMEQDADPALRGVATTLTYTLPAGVDLPQDQQRDLTTTVLSESPDGRQLSVQYECTVHPLGNQCKYKVTNTPAGCGDAARCYCPCGHADTLCLKNCPNGETQCDRRTDAFDLKVTCLDVSTTDRCARPKPQCTLTLSFQGCESCTDCTN